MWEGGRVKLRDLPREWRAVSAVRGIRDVVLVWTGILATAYAMSRVWHPAVYCVGLVVLGGLINHLTSLIHHSVHWNLHPHRAVNDWISRVFCAGPQGQFLAVIRREHLAHHARLGAASDPERFYYDLNEHGRLSPAGFLRWLVGIFAGWVVLPMVTRLIKGQRDGARADREESANGGMEGRHWRVEVGMVLAVQVALFFLFWQVTGAVWGYLAFWALPLVTVGAGLTVLRATLEHANPKNPDQVLLSFLSNPIERFFISPLQFNYHYEHHRFMTVPYYSTLGIRRMLMEADDYEGVRLVPSYIGRLAEVVRDLATLRGGHDGRARERRLPADGERLRDEV